MKNVLKNLIVEKIKGNSNQEITGQSLQDVLLSIVDSVYGDLEISMEGYSFEGIATVATVPPTLVSDADKRFYLAVDDGLYSNFAGLQSTPIIELSILRSTSRNYWEAISLKIPLNFEIKNELGTSQKDPMSQKKVTELYNQGYKYAGIAHTNDKVTTLTGDEKVFYIVAEEGDYSNFGLGNISELSVIKSENGRWKVEGLGVYLSVNTLINRKFKGTIIENKYYNISGVSVGTKLEDIPSASLAGYGHIFMTSLNRDDILVASGGGGNALGRFVFFKNGEVISVNKTSNYYNDLSIGIPEDAVDVLIQGSISRLSVTVTKQGKVDTLSGKVDTLSDSLRAGKLKELIVAQMGGINLYTGTNDDTLTIRARTIGYVKGQVKCEEGYQIYAIYYYRVDGTFIKSERPSSIITSISIKDDYVRLAFAKLDSSATFVGNEVSKVAFTENLLVPEISEMQSDLSHLNNEIFGNGETMEVSAGFYNLADGVANAGEYNINEAELRTDAGWYHGFLEVNEGDVILLSGGGALAARAYSFFDENGILLLKSSAEKFENIKVTAPINSSKILVQGQNPSASVELNPNATVLVIPKLVKKSNINCYYCGRHDTVVGISNNNYSNLISKYDKIMSDFPTMIEKNEIGSSVNGQTIYEYVFKTENYNIPDLARTPDAEILKKKVLIVAGIHGDEQAAINGLFFMLDDYIRGNSSHLDFLNNFTIHVVPCANPDGYNNSTRLNANSVNINRNFDISWVQSSESGTYAADQPETQAIQTWINNNTDAIVAIDFHNSGYLREIGYIGGSFNNSTDENLKSIKKSYLLINNNSISMWKMIYNITPSENRDYIWGYTGTIGSGGMCGSYMASKIAPSFTYETAIAIGDSTWNSHAACNVSAESFSNAMKAVNKVMGGI